MANLQIGLQVLQASKQFEAVPLESFTKSKQNLTSLFNAEDNDASNPPPAKRRRTIKHVEAACNPSDEPHTDNDIVLADIIFPITFQPKRSHEQAEVVREIPVTVRQGPSHNEPNEVAFCLYRQESNTDYITLICSTGAQDNVEAHFKNICALPPRRSARNKLSSSFYPMWTHARFIEKLDGSYVLHTKILSNTDSYSPARLDKQFRAIIRQVLETYYPRDSQLNADTSAQLFYDVVHTPDLNAVVPKAIQHHSVQTELYPFQKRAVSWLLSRERVKISNDGSMTPIADASAALPCSFQKYSDSSGKSFYASHLLRRVVRTPEQADTLHRHLYGGILSEEMGLGKTVELIDLLCLHRRTRDLGRRVSDAYTNTEVTVSSGTLIITPPAILDQWITEIRSHAPQLKVWHYRGVKQSTHDIEKILLEQDVVVATYNVLASEIHFADEKPNRSFRHQKKYALRRSPLVQILWWRVCLDEAQMIESGVSNAATVARRIPRCNAWAITGTPLKKDIKDLLGLLIFLRFEPFTDAPVWNEMCNYPDIFAQIFGTIAMRHTKAQIRQELQLPPQKRVVVTIPFTAIEEQHYKEMFEEMCTDVGLDHSGAPLSDDWDPNSESVIFRMRKWLTRLRQTCLHPEVGESNKRALGRRQGPLRTVEEVLLVMIDQNETVLRNEQRAGLMAKLIQGHLVSVTKDADKEQALHHYLEALETATGAVIECREQLRDETRRMQALHAISEQPGSDSDEPDDEKKERLGVCRNRLRSVLEMQHSCAFFVATAYYQVKMQKTAGDEDSSQFKDYESKEADYYETAKKIRQEMLRNISKKAIDSVDRVQESKKNGLGRLPRINEFANHGGIESRKIFRAVEDIRDLMNRQAEQLEEWRNELVDLLSANLLDQDDVELTGEEYDETLKNQDEQYVYLFVLRAAIAERDEMITGRVNVLVFHEVKEALELTNEGQGHSPELMKSCFELRSALLPARSKPRPPLMLSDNEQSLRGIMADLRSTITTVRFAEGGRGGSRATAEATILENELSSLQEVASEQTKALAALEKDFDLYRITMNERLEFYRQLQAISDTVKPYQEEESESLNETELKRQEQDEQKQNDKVRTLLTKRKFLQHLKSQKAGEAERRPCIICMQPFENGVLTVCAHEFCKECIALWLNQHHRCPMCKKHLRRNDYHNITYKPREMKAQEEQQSSSSDSSARSPSCSSGTSIYSNITEETLNEIKSIDIPRSWSSKIDSIIRHLLYLRTTDPGSKSVVFSQYRDFLSVLGRALHNCNIGYSEMVAKNGIQEFKEDLSVECFLLHAKADSSGLNLVNATHVLLCEPLINTALELQAVARVHRIGQCRPTTVWMYLVSDTVEEAIYDISVTRRMKLMAQKSGTASSAERSRTVTPAIEETKLDVVNSMELQQAPLSKLMAKGQNTGENVAKEDLWSCLFGKPSRDADDETNRQIEFEVSRHLRAEAADQRENAEAAG